MLEHSSTKSLLSLLRKHSQVVDVDMWLIFHDLLLVLIQELLQTHVDTLKHMVSIYTNITTADTMITLTMATPKFAIFVSFQPNTFANDKCCSLVDHTQTPLHPST